MGAHAAQFVRPPPTTTRRNIRQYYNYNCLQLIIIVIITSLAATTESWSPEEGDRERDALIRFKSSLRNADPSLGDWNNPPRPPCPSGQGQTAAWTGLICYEGFVWGLQLEHMNLSGEINVDALLPLGQLRSLSVMDNSFQGPLPQFRKLGALKALYISNNNFTGEIDDDAFMGMASLKKVYVSGNDFSGNVPNSLASSPRLLELGMENNHFSGPIPDFPATLVKFNASNNQLFGPIPPSLQDITDLSSFSGNKDLCGPPLDSKCAANVSAPIPASPAPPPAAAQNKTETLTIIALVLTGLMAIAVIAALYIVYHQNRAANTATDTDHNNHKDTRARSALAATGVQMASATAAYQQQQQQVNVVTRSNSKTRSSAGGGEGGGGHGKLTFLRDDTTRFDLQDLLRASAEVLGSGSFGSSYKAVLMDGQAVVVKRFKQMNNCGREEFHEHMRRLGRLDHPNLLPLLAYYYRKEEKLLVFNFVHNGSLARQLHGKHSVEKPGLDWPTRLKIIKGVAKGMGYLYTELPSLIVPHGHLKSSNVLLNESMEPLLMDYTLVPVVNLEQAHKLMVAYKAPEYAKQGRTTRKSDVWSLGILILEIMTGKFPANYLAPQGPPAADWVDSIVVDVGEAYANESELIQDQIDKEMGSTENAAAQMLKLLRIGVECCAVDVDKRVQLTEVVGEIQKLQERDNDA